jgi:hypothetical protein
MPKCDIYELLRGSRMICEYAHDEEGLRDCRRVNGARGHIPTLRNQLRIGGRQRQVLHWLAPMEVLEYNHHHVIHGYCALSRDIQ